MGGQASGKSGLGREAGRARTQAGQARRSGEDDWAWAGRPQATQAWAQAGRGWALAAGAAGLVWADQGQAGRPQVRHRHRQAGTHVRPALFWCRHQGSAEERRRCRRACRSCEALISVATKHEVAAAPESRSRKGRGMKYLCATVFSVTWKPGLGCALRETL